MATRKSAPVAEVEEAEVTTAEPTTKQLINEGIVKVIDATGIDVQKNRYKAMRAIAYQAFANAIADGTFDSLVDEAIANVDELPSGWEIERGEAAPVKAAPAKKAPAKAPAKAPVKAAAKPAAKTATASTGRARPRR